MFSTIEEALENYKKEIRKYFYHLDLISKKITKKNLLPYESELWDKITDLLDYRLTIIGLTLGLTKEEELEIREEIKVKMFEEGKR